MPGQKPDADHSTQKVIEAEVLPHPPSQAKSGGKSKKTARETAVDDESSGKTYFRSKLGGRTHGSDPEKPDPDLILMLQNCLPATHTIEIEGCRNGSRYEPYMNWIVSYIGDSGARDFAEITARDIWSDIYKHSFRQGPLYRWHVVCRSVELDQDGKMKAISSVRFLIDCTTSAEGSLGDELPTVDSLRSILSHAATFSGESRHMLGAFMGYCEKLLDQNIRVIEALPAAIEKAAKLSDVGMGVMEKAAEYHTRLLDETARREERVLIAKYETAKLGTISEAMKAGTEIFTGELAALALAWITSKGDNPFKDPNSMKEASSALLDTITRKQQKLVGDTAYASIVAKLTAASKQPTDVEAGAILMGCMLILSEYEAALKPTLSPEQKALLGFIKGRLQSTGS